MAAYLCAWLAHLGIEAALSDCTPAMSPAGIEFTAGAVGGQLLLDDLAATAGLIRFAGLESILAQLREVAVLDAETGGLNDCEIDHDGVRIRLRPAVPMDASAQATGEAGAALPEGST